jgi:L-amino acid N-acyltransferase YncA
MIRTATPSDAAAIATIYNHYIEHTVITFEEVPVSSGEIAARMTANGDTFPWFVCERDGTIAGYAYSAPWHKRAAYRNSVETSIYLDHSAIGSGVGTELYRHLLTDLTERKRHVAIGGIALPNDASVALHEKFGFEKAAHYREVGRKFDRWIDVGYWQKILPSGPAELAGR